MGGGGRAGSPPKMPVEGGRWNQKMPVGGGSSVLAGGGGREGGGGVGCARLEVSFLIFWCALYVRAITTLLCLTLAGLLVFCHSRSLGGGTRALCPATELDRALLAIADPHRSPLVPTGRPRPRSEVRQSLCFCHEWGPAALPAPSGRQRRVEYACCTLAYTVRTVHTVEVRKSTQVVRLYSIQLRTFALSAQFNVWSCPLVLDLGNKKRCDQRPLINDKDKIDSTSRPACCFCRRHPAPAAPPSSPSRQCRHCHP